LKYALLVALSQRFVRDITEHGETRTRREILGENRAFVKLKIIGFGLIILPSVWRRDLPF
jgi:hypothetical protein